MIRTPAFESCTGIQHGFLTRQGGASEGVFDSLNCGYGSGDDSANVRSNRGYAAAKLGLGADDMATLYQIHSAEVVEVTEPWSLDNRPRADAMVTRTPELALGILTADCVPVLFADAQSRIIGAAHAGWKGALAGVVAATVAAMEKLGAERSRMTAAIGPCIRQPSYEVGPELRQAFLDQDSVHACYFSPSVRDNHFMFDLAGYVRDTAERAGIGDVVDVARDTYVEEQLFYSYRRATHRGEADYGRGISLISLEQD